MKNTLKTFLCALCVIGSFQASALGDVLRINIADARLGDANVSLGPVRQQLLTNYGCHFDDTPSTTNATYNGVPITVAAQFPYEQSPTYRYTQVHVWTDSVDGAQFRCDTIVKTNGVHSYPNASDIPVGTFQFGYYWDQPGGSIWSLEDLIRDGSAYLGRVSNLAGHYPIRLSDGNTAYADALRNNVARVYVSNVRLSEETNFAIDTHWRADASIVVAPESFFQGDFDQSGTKDTADVYAFLECWFAGDCRADQNFDTNLSVDDVFSFVEAWVGL